MIRIRGAFYLLMVLSLALGMISCDKLGQGNNPDLRPLLITNSPVKTGEYLEVKVQNTSDDHFYSFKSPSGWDLSIPNFQTDSALLFDQGWYRITATGQNGFTAIDSVFVRIVPEPIPCKPIAGQLAADSGLITSFFKYYVDIVSGHRRIYADGLKGDFTLFFKQGYKPLEEGTYSTVSTTSDFKWDDDVIVDFSIFGKEFSSIPNQKIHVAVDGQKTIISCCALKGVHSQTGDALSVDVQIELE